MKIVVVVQSRLVKDIAKYIATVDEISRLLACVLTYLLLCVLRKSTCVCWLSQQQQA